VGAYRCLTELITRWQVKDDEIVVENLTRDRFQECEGEIEAHRIVIGASGHSVLHYGTYSPPCLAQ